MPYWKYCDYDFISSQGIRIHVLLRINLNLNSNNHYVEQPVFIDSLLIIIKTKWSVYTLHVDKELKDEFSGCSNNPSVLISAQLFALELSLYLATLLLCWMLYFYTSCGCGPRINDNLWRLPWRVGTYNQFSVVSGIFAFKGLSILYDTRWDNPRYLKYRFHLLTTIITTEINSKS